MSMAYFVKKKFFLSKNIKKNFQVKIRKKKQKNVSLMILVL